MSSICRDDGSRHRLHGERTGDAGLPAVAMRLVVEHGLVGRLVISQGPRRDGGNAAVAEAGPDSLVGMGQLVIVIIRGHQPLPGNGDGHPRGVAGDPAAAPLLSDIARWCRNHRWDRIPSRRDQWSSGCSAELPWLRFQPRSACQSADIDAAQILLKLSPGNLVFVFFPS